MGWIRIQDDICRNPKMAAAGPLAIAMQVAGIAYCNDQLTDGFVPTGIAPTLLRLDGIAVRTASIDSYAEAFDDASWFRVIDDLESAGLWAPVDGGWQIHDYLKYQKSAATIRRERELAYSRMQRFRSNNSETALERRNNAVTTAKQRRSNGSVTAANQNQNQNQDPDQEKDPPSSQKRERRSVPRNPLPFTVPTALEAIAKTADGRFVVSEPTKGAAIRLNTAIRKFPDLADWSLFGEYLAAGGRSWQSEPFGPSACASAKWPELVAEARAWRDDGKPPLTKPHRAYSSPPPSRHMQPVSDFSSVRPGQHDLRDYLPDAPARRTT